jgi:hypothetical protein
MKYTGHDQANEQQKQELCLIPTFPQATTITAIFNDFVLI